MRFPKRIRHRGRVLAIIYRKCKGREDYRVCWRVAGRRRMAAFPTYAAANEYAQRTVRELARGSQSSALTADQARNALAALERLQVFNQASPHPISLLSAVSAYCEAAVKLTRRNLNEAVDAYIRTVASVTRKGIAEAVEEFISARQPKTEAKDGKRPQLSAGYAYNVAMWLREFSRTFPNTAVSDLTKKHLNAYMAKPAIRPR